jgi:Xaa-Pro dipeptidase
LEFTQRLEPAFYRAVQADVRSRMEAAGLDALALDHPEDVAYLTGFFHHPCERPVVVHVDATGPVTLLVPELEREHAEVQRSQAEIVTYPEFPGVRSPFDVLAAAVRGDGRIGVSPEISLVRHRRLRESFSGAGLVETDLVTCARYVKRPEEVELHQEAARITDTMLEAGIALIEAAVRGNTELPSEAELASHVGSVGVETMYSEHTDVVVSGFLAGGLVYSGPNSAKPHGLPSAHRLQRGETFMLSLGCAVGGRYVEGERTFILGEPSQEQVRYYETIRAAQQTGIDTLRPGLTCAEANGLCLQVIRDAGLGQFIQHRQGHGIGLGMHEPPWLEDGDDTVLEAGFVVSNEPGIYIPGHAGYRISDSMLVTDEGARPFTSHPKKLDDVVVAA